MSNPDVKIIEHRPTDAEIVFGGCLYTPPEYFNRFDALESYLTTYINLDVRKHLGLSFDEYMNKTYYEMSIIDKVLRATQEKLRAEEKKQENQFSNPKK